VFDNAKAQVSLPAQYGKGESSDGCGTPGPSKTILAAVYAYANAIAEDTARMAPVGYVRDETGYLKDATAEIAAALSGPSTA
jgi:hypothetical protein